MRSAIVALLAILRLAAPVFAAEEQPACQGVGTRFEGWFQGGQLIQTSKGQLAWDSCTSKISVCTSTAEEGEGWYAVTQPELITYANCATAESRPVCGAIGTRSEGWYLDGRLLNKFNGVPAFANCAGQVAICYAQGTRSEGWYATSHPELLLVGHCSE